ncbi:MAG: hypothetical protein HQ596_06515 [Candidatus Saganbacteria bacterium]|nr:hypothetical protein [Candidatus Saganbacteria bacterium]
MNLFAIIGLGGPRAKPAQLKAKARVATAEDRERLAAKGPFCFIENQPAAADAAAKLAAEYTALAAEQAKLSVQFVAAEVEVPAALVEVEQMGEAWDINVYGLPSAELFTLAADVYAYLRDAAMNEGDLRQCLLTLMPEAFMVARDVLQDQFRTDPFMLHLGLEMIKAGMPLDAGTQGDIIGWVAERPDQGSLGIMQETLAGLLRREIFITEPRQDGSRSSGMLFSTAKAIERVFLDHASPGAQRAIQAELLKRNSLIADARSSGVAMSREQIERLFLTRGILGVLGDILGQQP